VTEGVAQMAHILGAITMRVAVMTKGEFTAWLEKEYPDKTEQAIIMQQLTEQIKEKKYSYGKVY